MTDQFGEHHLIPELAEVQQHEQDNNQTQNEHVLRCPFHAFRTSVDSVTVVTTCLTVLQGKNDSVHEVAATAYQLEPNSEQTML